MCGAPRRDMVAEFGTWQELSKKLRLSSPSDARSVALVAVGLARALDMHEWVAGRASSRRWLQEIPAACRELDDAPVDTLDSWTESTRASVLSSCAGSRADLPDLFAELRLWEENEEKSKLRGAIYTPSWLAGRVTRNAVVHWRRLHRSGRQPQVLADVSCGTGVFLAQANVHFRAVPRVYGIDNDHDALEYCKALKCALNADWELLCADSLFATPEQMSLVGSDLWMLEEGSVDVLLGNPPYVRSQLLDRAYAASLRRQYPMFTEGNFDLVVLFLEQAMRLLSPGGIASYVISSKFMTSTYGKAICRRLANDARIINVENFNDAQLFPGRTTYTCILTIAKLAPARRFTVTQFPAGVTAGEDPGKGHSYTLPSTRLQTHPWDFTGGPEQKALQKLRESRHPLLTRVFTGIMQGVRTGANEVFVVPAQDTPDLEFELLVKFVKGEDIRRMRLTTDRLRLLFPYKYDAFGEPSVLSIQELQRYPRVWAHLESQRQVLVDRALDKGAPWYAFSRSQNLRLPRIRKLLVREMMPRAEFAADLDGTVAFSSGYALIADRMSEDDLLLWTAVLNTPTMEFVLRHNGTQLHSGWFRLLKHHLRRTRLPLLSTGRQAEALDLARRLSRDPGCVEAWEALDAAVAEGFALTQEERRAIYLFLEDCHKRSLAEDVRATSISLAGDEEGSQPGSDGRDYEPVRLDQYDSLHRDRSDLSRAVTFALNKGLPIHRWYPFTQGYSEPLVEGLLDELGVGRSQIVLDPFAGVAATNLVCKRRRIASIGVEISPLMAWIGQVKTRRWDVDELGAAVKRVESASFPSIGHRELVFEDYFARAYSPLILNQLVGIAEYVKDAEFSVEQREFLLLGLVGIMEQVSYIRKHGSHYRFMTASENIGLQKLNTQVIAPDADVRPIFLDRLRSMLNDVGDYPMPDEPVRCDIVRADARCIPLQDGCVDMVITSPPYLNRNNYIAQQKAEMAILGMVKSYEQYRALVRSTVRSHVDAQFGLQPESRFPEVARIVDAIALSPNNNPHIPHMVAGYFEDLDKVVGELARVMSPVGLCAFVVGNTRWGGVVVPVDHLLMLIGEQHGFVPDRILVTRLKGNSPQQMRRYGRIPVRESVVVFRKC